MLSSGCATSLSTLKTNDQSIRTQYYKASYETAINAACEAASKISDWKVQDVDDATGIITVGESKNMWRYYIIKILVKKVENDIVSIDVTVEHSTDWLSLNKEYITTFYNRLGDVLKPLLSKLPKS
jgi:hypothetical protein